MLEISSDIRLPLSEIEITAVRAQGAGGQNVNKVSSAVHLRFDIMASSLPAHFKARMRALPDRRITREGVVVIKAQQARSQEQNRTDALDRLQALIRRATLVPRRRTATRPTRAARQRRMDSKTRRGRLKTLRQKVDTDL